MHFGANANNTNLINMLRRSQLGIKNLGEPEITRETPITRDLGTIADGFQGASRSGQRLSSERYHISEGSNNLGRHPAAIKPARLG